MIEYIRLNIRPGDLKIEIPLFPGERSQLFQNLRAFISTKSAGDMDMFKKDTLPDRSRFFARSNIDEASVYSLCQKHTMNVVKVEKGTPFSAYQDIIGDGMIAQEKGIYLSITVADCLPIFLIDGNIGAFALVHSGWKGTGIAAAAIDQMQREYGSKVENIKAVIGPGIGACCYHVPSDRYDNFKKEFGADSCREVNGNYYIDLRKANIALIQKAGVTAITIVEECTSCSPDLHSFRREGKENFGRAIAMIGYSESE